MPANYIGFTRQPLPQRPDRAPGSLLFLHIDDKGAVTAMWPDTRKGPVHVWFESGTAAAPWIGCKFKTILNIRAMIDTAIDSGYIPQHPETI